MNKITQTVNPIEFISLEKNIPQFTPQITSVLQFIRNNTGISQTLEEIMDIIWTATTPILPHDRIGLSFIDNDNQRVTAHYFRTLYNPDDVKLGNQYSSGLANSSLLPLLQKNSARIINDLPRYLHDHPLSHSSSLLVNEGIQSNLTLPLSVDKRPVGFLFFSSKQPNAFSSIHAQILLAVSDIISQNIEKIWRIRKLEEAKQDYLSMLGFVSHEMKSPLASMMTVGTTYTKGYIGPVDPLAKTTIDKMMRISGYLINMVNNYLDLSRLETGQMAFNPQPNVNFNTQILEFARDTVSARAEERGSRFIINAPQTPVILTADIDLLRIVAVNLLDNAIKYGNDHIDILITLEIHDNTFSFSVKNEGVGFDKEQAQKLFRRFSRLKQKGTEDRRGTGLGLYLTWWIIQKHNGSISAQSEPGQWAEFTVTLPL